MSNDISAVMIVKDCEDHLERTVSSFRHCGIDELVIVDTGSTDRTPKIAKRLADVFDTYEDTEMLDLGDGTTSISDFAQARNFAKDRASGKYIFSIDSDDLLDNPRGFASYLDEFVRQDFADAYNIAYDYEHDHHGNCILRHPVIRIANRELHEWRSPIHEILCFLFDPNVAGVDPEVFKIVHDRDPFQAGNCQRNIKVCEHWIEKNSGNVEPRMWLNYGKSLRGANRCEESIEALRKYLEGSQWNHERYFAHLMIASDLFYLKQPEPALEELFRAVQLLPEYRDAPIEIARFYIEMQEWDKALFWCDHADRLDADNSAYYCNPLVLDIGSTRLRARAHLERGEFKECFEAASKVLEHYPMDHDSRTWRVLSAKLLKEQSLVQSWKRLEFMAFAENDSKKLESLKKATPKAIEGRPEINVPVEIDVRDPKIRVGIFCGQTPDTWGHDSLDKKAVGGSETAVILMSDLLAQLEFRVEVYAFMDEQQEGEHEGVLWLPYYRFPAVPKPDIFIAWRLPGYVREAPQSKLRYVWCHDVQRDPQWSDEVLALTDGVMLLSEAHRKTANRVPDEKVFMTSNGLSATWFDEITENDPHSVIYASCPTRGLLNLLDMWDTVREAVPDATLNIYYGFNPWYLEHMKNSEYHRRVYREVHHKSGKNGVVFHGSVNQFQLAKAFKQSGIWAYPTNFYEISCITAMQAQATGAWPVTTGHAALSETVQFGDRIGGPEDEIDKDQQLKDGYLTALIERLRNPPTFEQRQEMAQWAKMTYSWAEVAKTWKDRFVRDLREKSPVRLMTSAR